jgi:hypothetical protein
LQPRLLAIKHVKEAAVKAPRRPLACLGGIEVDDEVLTRVSLEEASSFDSCRNCRRRSRRDQIRIRAARN